MVHPVKGYFMSSVLPNAAVSQAGGTPYKGLAEVSGKSRYNHPRLLNQVNGVNL